MPNLPSIIVLSRPKNAVPPLLALMIGYAFAGGLELTVAFGAAWVSVLLLNCAATLQNDLADQAIDAAAHRATPLLRGAISARAVRLAALGMMGLALAVSLVLAQAVVAAFLLVYMLLVWAYNRPPLRLSHRPLSSIVALALLFYTMPFLLGAYVAADEVSTWLLAGLAMGGFLLRFAISMLKDYKDFAADRAHRKRTFLIRYGANGVRRTSLALATIGYVAIVTVLALAMPSLAKAAIMLAVLVPLAWYGVRLRLRLSIATTQFGANNVVFHQVIDATNFFDIGALLCLYYF